MVNKDKIPAFLERFKKKKEESRYNGRGAVLLLCGRAFLLHRGMRGGNPLYPASIYLDGTILLHNGKDCKAISNGPKRAVFFVVQRVAYRIIWKLSGPPRVEPGYWARARHKAGSEVGSAPWNIPSG